MTGEKARAQAETGVKAHIPSIHHKGPYSGALKENPNFNSSYDHETMEIILKKYYNIGIAAEAPDGLKVVVIKIRRREEHTHHSKGAAAPWPRR